MSSEELCYLLFPLVVLLPLLAMRLGPRGSGGAVELISANTVFLSTYLIYVGLSAAIYLSQGFRSYWAPFVSDPRNMVGVFLASLLALGAYLTVYVLVGRLGRGREGRTTTIVEPNTGFWATAIVLIAAGVLLKLYFISSLGGFEATSIRLSGGVSTALGLESISPTLIAVRHLSGLADAAALWAWVVSIRRKKRRLLWSSILLVVMALVYVTTAKRLYMLLPAIAVGLTFSYYVRPIKLSALPYGLVAALAAGGVSLIYRSIVPMLLYGQVIDMRAVGWANGSLLAFYFNSLEYSTFDMMAVAMVGAHEISDWLGGSLQAFYISNIEPFFYIVPRFIWPDKPEQLSDISFAINWYITRGASKGAYSVGLASTAIGSFWVLGGPVGLTIAMGFLGWLAAVVDRARPVGQFIRDSSIIRYAFMITVVFHLFRQGSLGWAFIVVATQQIGLLIGLMLMWIATSLSQRHPRLAPLGTVPV